MIDFSSTKPACHYIPETLRLQRASFVAAVFVKPKKTANENTTKLKMIQDGIPNCLLHESPEIAGEFVSWLLRLC